MTVRYWVMASSIKHGQFFSNITTKHDEWNKMWNTLKYKVKNLSLLKHCISTDINSYISFGCIYWLWRDLIIIVFLSDICPFQGKEIHANESSGLLLTPSSLTLLRVNRDWSGDFRCAASNVEGDSSSNTVSVVIKCEAWITDKFTIDVKLKGIVAWLL